MSENINETKHHAQKVKIGEIIAEIRLDQKLTQNELALKAGMRQPNLARIEKGDVNFSIDTLFDIADALDVSVLHILVKAFWNKNIVSVNGKVVEEAVDKLYQDILGAIMNAVK